MPPKKSTREKSERMKGKKRYITSESEASEEENGGPSEPQRKKSKGGMNTDGKTRWVAPEFLKDDDPLYDEIRGLPNDKGENLTKRQILLLCRRSPAERIAKARFYFGYGGKRKYVFRSDRPKKSPDKYDYFEKLNDADFVGLGISREELPVIATGGAAKKPVSGKGKGKSKGKGKEKAKFESDSDEESSFEPEAFTDDLDDGDGFDDAEIHETMRRSREEHIFGESVNGNAFKKGTRQTYRNSKKAGEASNSKNITPTAKTEWINWIPKFKAVWDHKYDTAEFQKYLRQHPMVGYSGNHWQTHLNRFPGDVDVGKITFDELKHVLKGVFSYEIGRIENASPLIEVGKILLEHKLEADPRQVGLLRVDCQDRVEWAARIISTDPTWRFILGFSIPGLNSQGEGSG
ncbi:hypothetical protein VTL71DRAFT_11216 [Oculimacula yallundae]|uniref:Uncharacterized protein n=1 Tax=Oculimacula yallundae TaxID=86028 RepID=A0ABR4CVI9_9HELO